MWKQTVGRVESFYPSSGLASAGHGAGQEWEKCLQQQIRGDESGQISCRFQRADKEGREQTAPWHILNRGWTPLAWLRAAGKALAWEILGVLGEINNVKCRGGGNMKWSSLLRQAWDRDVAFHCNQGMDSGLFLGSESV